MTGSPSWSPTASDHIVVLHDGELTEHGTHDQLVAAGGNYAELFALQAAAYGDASATITAM